MVGVGGPALRIHTITTGVVCYDQVEAHTSSRLCCQFRILNQRRRRSSSSSRSRSSNLYLAFIYCNNNNNNSDYKYNSHPQDAGNDFILASLLLSGLFSTPPLQFLLLYTQILYCHNNVCTRAIYTHTHNKLNSLLSQLTFIAAFMCV